MNLSDLQRKDIVNTLDGKKLGRIIDATITNEGTLEYFVVAPAYFFRFWKAREEQTISFKDIKKIGTDVILVEF